MTGTLAATMAVGPLALFALSALSPFVTTDLGLRPSQFGALATLSFAAATPRAWLLGRWLDRCSARGILFGVFSLSGLALLVTASAQSFGWLVVGVLITGVAMSVTNPVTNRLVSVQVADGQRGAVMGVKQSGVQLGQLLVGLALPSLAVLIGWRGAVAATCLWWPWAWH